MAATMTDIAREANVSISLVSKLLRNDPSLKVSPATKQRVLDVCKRMDGVRSLNVRLSDPCRVVVPVNRIFAHDSVDYIAKRSEGQAVQQIIEQQGGRLSVVLFVESQCLSTIEKLMDDPDYCNALLFFGGLMSTELAELLHRRKFPHICLNDKDSRYPVNTFFLDVQGAMRQVIDHLYDLGHRHIAYAGPTRQRLPHLVAALVEHELTYHSQAYCLMGDYVPAHSDPDEGRKLGYEYFKRWLKNRPTHITAIVAHNDYIALGVIDAMHDAGLRPGHDLSVVGFDNIESGKTLNDEKPCLTTVDYPRTDIGKRAAERLLAQHQKRENLITHERYPARLVIRQSTGPVFISGVAESVE